MFAWFIAVEHWKPINCYNLAYLPNLTAVYIPLPNKSFCAPQFEKIEMTNRRVSRATQIYGPTPTPKVKLLLLIIDRGCWIQTAYFTMYCRERKKENSTYIWMMWHEPHKGRWKLTDKADNLTVQTVGLVTLMLMMKTSNDDKEKNSDDNEDM